MQTEQQTQERRIVNPRREDLTPKNPLNYLERERRLRKSVTAQATMMETAATNSGAERTSLNEFRVLKYFKIKW